MGAIPTHTAHWKKVDGEWCAKPLKPKEVGYRTVLRMLRKDGQVSYRFALVQVEPGVWSVSTEKEVDIAFSDDYGDEYGDFDYMQW